MPSLAIKVFLVPPPASASRVVSSGPVAPPGEARDQKTHPEPAAQGRAIRGAWYHLAWDHNDPHSAATASAKEGDSASGSRRTDRPTLGGLEPADGGDSGVG